MNDVALTGRLTSNPIIYENEDPKKQAAHFFLAVKKLGKRQEGEDTSFIPCVVFGKRGEHIHKGMLIGITGWIETSRREKEDGTMEYPWEVIVREMDFLEPKKNSENQNSTDGYNNYQEGQNNYQSGNNQIAIILEIKIIIKNRVMVMIITVQTIITEDQVETGMAILPEEIEEIHLADKEVKILIMVKIKEVEEMRHL